MAPSSYLNRRYLLVLVVSAVLCFALYAVTGHRNSYEGARDAAYRVWKEPFWSSGSSLRNTKALSYVGGHPGSLEGWEDGSLKRWADSPDIDPEYYTTEHSPRPTSGPYTGGVVWLTRRQHIRETLASLETLARYMPMEQAYSFILLHSGDLAGPDTQRETLSAWAERAEELTGLGQGDLAGKMKVMGQGIEFVQIDLAAPVEWQREGIRHRDDVVFDGVWPGYHSMCRFFAAEIFWHPRMRQLDYYMRMDHDSYILTPMHMDPFKRMHTTGKSYIFRQPSGDGEWVLKGLPDYIEAWVDAHEHDAGAEGILHRVDDSRLIAAPRNERNGGMESYYNNWEMAHVPSFRRKGVRDWLVGLLEHNDGFYKSRWGDAPLRFATVKMFFEAHEYEQWCDFTYYHQQMMPEGERLTNDPPTWRCSKG